MTKTDEIKGTYVPTTRTQITHTALAAALHEAFATHDKARQDVKVTADAHTVAVLVAMSAHETAEWLSCWNNNLGNVKAAPSWPGLFVCLNNVWEIIGGQKRWFSPKGATTGKNGPVIGRVYTVPPGHPQTRFRAYATLAEGVAGFVDKMLGLYRPSLDVLLAGGSSDDFVASLKRQRYFTGDLVGYQRSVRHYLEKFAEPMTTHPHTLVLEPSEAQGRLRQLGFYLGKLDGVVGPLTVAATKAFQREAGLTVDGVVGPITSAALVRLTPTYGRNVAAPN